MPSTRIMWASAVVLAVLACACSGADSGAATTLAFDVTTTTQVPASTTSTTSPPASTTAAPEQTTTSVPGQVGDPEALRRSFEELERLISADITYDEPVPIPDLTNPDPVVALAEAFRFEVWLMENGPHSAWADGYNYPDSPRRRSAITNLNRWFRTEHAVSWDHGYVSVHRRRRCADRTGAAER